MTATRHLRLGTRGSALALAQSKWTARQLEALHPGLTVELIPILTRGDTYAGPLAPVGGKGLFTEELESGLQDGSLDLAVHSLKDLPVTLPDGLILAAFPPREDPRDALITEVAQSLADLPQRASVLTGSLRRRAQLLRRRPDLDIRPVRGNIDTRLRRWRDGEGDAVILAAAGLNRLGVKDVPAHPLDPDTDGILPAPGQGILALEVRAGSRAEAICAAFNDPTTAAAAHAERHVVAAFGGDCTLPLAAWAEAQAAGTFRVRAALATPDADQWAEGEGQGDSALEAAAACVEAMHRDGAEAVLAAIRAAS
jgi:hydroxymethylbilane synthase